MANTTENKEMVVSQNELSEVEKNDVASAPVSVFEQSAQQIFSTIEATDRKSRVKLYNAVNDANESLSDHLGEAIRITDLVAHPIKLENEQGELVEALRTIIVAEDGSTYHSVSNGVVDSFQKIIALVGHGPWTDEPLTIVAKEQKTRKGYRVMTLTLLDD
ncbi:hypothetical protein [Bacillus sp. WC2502]|uniref:hypothetical protein n=1 Tax=Bacillus sp. WC2502 TaxID=3461401 RepID=UPI004044A2B4